MFTLQCRVWGQVQGVGFRFYTKMLADKHHLKGTVQNKIDGSVLITIQAPPEEAYAFVDRIKDNPPSPYAKIRKMEVAIVEDAPVYQRFDIRY